MKMRRLLLAFLMAMMICITSYAQEKKDFQTTRVIKGAVIDKKGNPLPGATVRATGGAEFVTTDSDGSFSIEVPIWLESLTASYPGLRNNKMEITAYDMMIFKLKSLKRTHGFVNLMFANVWQVKPTGGYNDKVQQLGLMGGAYRKWGGYAKVMFGFLGSNNGQYTYHKNVWPDPTITGGFVKPINQYLNVFAGPGIAFNYNFFPGSEYGDPNLICKEQCFALAFEGGVMYKWKKLNGILGLTYVTKSLYFQDVTKYIYNEGNLALFLGVGLNI